MNESSFNHVNRRLLPLHWVVAKKQLSFSFVRYQLRRKRVPRYNVDTTGEGGFHPGSQNSKGFPLTHTPGQTNLS